ncbi:MAG TPA: ATP-binding protein [Polyangiaceae bacterium]|nr:ATP-binding protein [Polyangiaceae bacterium]
MTLLSQPPPADPGATPAVTIPEIRVSTTLDALDDAIGMLSELEAGPGSKVGRRGRIDLAALLWEVAPTAQISIEPGAGTEVFGEEGDLRRILHVLVQLSNSTGGGQDAATSAVRIRREGDWIRIGVDLGPDVSASVDLERRWLSRMATQMGGHLDLEGGMIALLLPADASNDQSEVADLRKELEQAQQLGEAYARELAAAFAAGQPAEVETASDRGDVAARRFDLLVAMSSALHHVLAPVFRGLRDDSENQESGPPSDAIAAHLARGFELVAEVGRVAACPRSESVEPVKLGKALKDAAGESESRAVRHGVTLRLEVAGDTEVAGRPRALSLLLRAALGHGIDATPRGGEVRASVTAEPGGAVLRVRDGGPAVPASARADLLEHRVDPSALGRPPGLGLLVTHTVAAYLGGSARLTESEDGAFVTEIRIRSA